MWFERRKRKKAIDSIRIEMLLFGYDLIDMTDEEIEEGVNRFAALAPKSGVSAAQAGEALRKTMLETGITT